jgi:DNA transformation protein and related proteins
MPTERNIVDYVLERLGPEASARAMFGEYGVYFQGVLIGLVCDDRLFMKETEAGSRLAGPHECDAPYPGAKPAILFPEELWDTPVLRQVAAATADALKPAPPTRRARGARNRDARTHRRR